MKTKLFFLFLMLTSIGAMFASTKIGNLYYNLDATNRTAEVTSQNSNYPYWSTSITAANIPSSVTYNNKSYSVTSIGDHAFYQCDGLTSVTIGNSVKSIGDEAFYHCDGLTSVTIPNSVTSIGDHAFTYCKGLTSPVYNTHVFAYMPTKYTGAYTIPDGIESIASAAFRFCAGMTSIEIPNSVTSIGSAAFQDCSGLTSVTIPNSVTSIGQSAFRFCTGLTSPVYNVHVFACLPTSYSGAYTIPDGIESIAGSAFHNCSSLTSIEIPNSVTSIGKEAFYNCSGLTSVTIPNSVTSIGQSAFRFCTGLTSPVYNVHVFACLPTSYSGAYTIPDGIESIAGGAFYNCSSLTSIEIPNSVTNIGDHAFYGCTSLTTIEIPNSITNIGNSAFSGCAGLTSVTIPNSVTSIGGYAFYRCTNLISIKNKVEIPPTLGENTFDTANDCSIYVPCGTLDTYKVAWSLYASQIEYEPLEYTITIYPSEYGFVKTPTSICDLPLIATPNYGYHFVQWSDGNINNPRIITLTQDTSFAAEFAINQYNIDVSCEREYGIIEGESGDFDYRTTHQYKAVANYGYYFTKWSDGVTNNPRILTVERDSIITASFAPNKYKIQEGSNATYGYIDGTGSFDYLSERTITGVPQYGYHFTQWSDGNTENPRTIVLTQDTTFAAEFAPNKYTISVTCDETYGNIEGENGEFDYLTTQQYKAVAHYGYYFYRWSDGKTQNPRTITVNADISITAEFKPNKYKIQDGSNSRQGYISGTGSFDYLSERTITGVPQYGYHFVKWADNYTDNPRTIILTQDTTFTAEFGINQYTISVTCDETYGHIEGENGSFDYLTTHEYKAIANYGYHFDRWSDGKTQNPRTITVNADINITASFSVNKYTIIDGSNSSQGYINGVGAYDYMSERTITAVNQYGYHFTNWSDGVTDNPRTIVLTKDTTFTAEFGIDKTGVCGINNELVWAYEDKSKTLTINGVGALTSNYTFGVEAPTEMQNLIIGNDVTAIGERAFYAKSTLNHLTIGGNVTSIGDYAFAECKNFDDITCYATTVPTISDKTFYNVGNKQYIYLYVPVDRERAYKRDVNWGQFDIQIKGAEETTTDGGVAVVPTDNTVEITWPSVNKAETYEIVITKDGDVVCTLIFNANGQLAGIAFAPGRNGSNHTQQAQTAGFKFIVTGLTGNTTYNYAVASKDNTGNTIDTKSGSFTTTGGEQGLEDSVIETQKANKLLRDGQILILRGDRTYTLTGQEVK